ncbi:hypothetical protein [Colwellia sp. RSH04]|uniref:hypothetical protein n=1 Tax=Colwellia sp. RSH04 TaxID=2305464 RepID=UPI000E5849AE|nr:hypothetical protein [Colwellia sp. RSH04]RHW75051.1 hypothetical protein D1094_15615 [Colwellia sp. RSH04]
MPYLPPPEFLSGHKTTMEDVKERKLLELTSRRLDGSTYIASIYLPLVILETKKDKSFLKRIFLKVLVSFKIAKP